MYTLPHIYIHDRKYCEKSWFDVELLTTGPSEAYSKQVIHPSSQCKYPNSKG
jgi:hypothetical protein